MSPRRACLRVPKWWFEVGYKHHASTAVASPLEDCPTGWLRDHMRLIGPVDLPALGYRTISVSAKDVGVPDPLVSSATGIIESPYHRLSYDPILGRVTGIFDKVRKREVLDTANEWPFFGFIHESVDPLRHSISWPAFGRNAQFNENFLHIYKSQSGWNPNWPAVRRGPDRLISCSTEHDAEGMSLVLTWNAPGCERLEQRITLSGWDAGIRCEARMLKSDLREAEASYFAFPLSLEEKWRAHFDTAGIPTELDVEQLPGSCRDWVTVDRWVSMHDRTSGVTLSCLDAPLVQIGGFHFGRASRSIPRPPHPLLLGWATNNYWTTNFRGTQPGMCVFRYVFTTHGPFDPVTSQRLGEMACSPVEIHPVIKADALESQLLEVQGDPFDLIVLKPSEDGASTILRMINPASGEATVRVKLSGRTLLSANRLSTLEEPRAPLEIRDGMAVIAMEGRSLLTVSLRTS